MNQEFRVTLLAGVAASALAAASPMAAAQSKPAGVFLEVEGQLTFGASDFDLGVSPVTLNATSTDEGNGAGGAVTLGYVMSSGWSTSLRYRRSNTDHVFGQQSPPLYGNLPAYLPLPIGRAEVSAQYHALDFEVGKDFGLGTGTAQLFGGIKYAQYDRHIEAPLAGYPGYGFLMRHEFEGVGPRIGIRGSIPVASGVSLVGSTAIAALFGEAQFSDALTAGGASLFPFSATDDRTVAALDAEAGLSFSLGSASLTVGYRIDTMFNALDTDQRFGLFQIGSRDDDVVQHGVFGRLTMPLGGGN